MTKANKLILPKDKNGRIIRKKKNKGGRPKNCKTKPPLEVTEEVARGLLAERDATIPNNILAKGIPEKSKVDYKYFAEAFKALKAQWEGKVPDVKPKGDETRRYTPLKMFQNCCMFFEFTLDACKPLTFSGMAMFMGMKRVDMFHSIHRQALAPEYHFIYEFASFIEMYNEFAAHQKQNPAGPIFIMKNIGWKDKLEIEATPTDGSLTDEERGDAQKRIKNFSE